VRKSLKFFSNWLHKPLNLFLLLLSLVPILSIILLVVIKGVNIPYLDQWGTSANVAVKTAERSLTFMDLLSLHGDHRIFFSKIITAIVTLTTRWNIKVEMLVSVMLSAINFMLLVGLFRLDLSEATAVILVPFSALIFSMRQVENWLWGFQTCWFFVLTFFYAALWVLRRYPISWRSIMVASFLSFCATFSLGSGFFVWPLLLIVMVTLGYRQWKFVAFWIGSAAASVLLFIKEYKFGVRTEIITDIKLLIRYVISYLGGPLVPATGRHVELLKKPWITDLAIMIALVGLALLIANVFSMRRKDQDWRKITSWLALTGYSIGVAMVTAVSRASRARDYFPHQSLLSRYVTASTPIWIAIVALLVMMIWRLLKDENQRNWEKLLLRGNIVAAFLIAGLYIYVNIDAVRQPLRVTEEQKDCLLAYPSTRDTLCMIGISFNINKWLPTIEQLAEYRLSAFSDSEEIQFHPEPTLEISLENDFVFNVRDPNIWKFSGMVPTGSEKSDSWIVGGGPHMVYTKPLNLCLSDYSHLRIVMSVSPNIRPNAGYMQIYYKIYNRKQLEEPISIAVIADGNPHTYVYNLQLLEHDSQTRLTHFRIDPIVRGSSSGDTVVRILNIRLVRGKEPSQCLD
jgi:hypothetical protein